uniref:(northern house mosquito) hypothetical protein n=1 Tax=Culex pipiens TaxID=7175 RepID=A0A8D8JCK1_CULPI
MWRLPAVRWIVLILVGKSFPGLSALRPRSTSLWCNFGRRNLSWCNGAIPRTTLICCRGRRSMKCSVTTTLSTRRIWTSLRTGREFARRTTQTEERFHRMCGHFTKKVARSGCSTRKRTFPVCTK